MPVPEQTPVATFTGNGVTTDFPFTWGASAAAHVVVEVDDIELVQGVDYTVLSIGDAGGTVRITPAPALDAAVSVFRRTPLERVDIDYQEAGPFLAETVDLDFNTLWRAVQEIGYTVGLVPQLPVGSPLAGTVRFPPPGAGLFLRWNAAGTDIEAVDVETEAPISTLRADLADDAVGQGGALVTIKSSLPGAVARSTRGKLDEIVSLTDFGAITGVDDTALLQRAFDAIASVIDASLVTVGGVSASYAGTLPRLKLPKGRLKISAAITVPAYLDIDGDCTIIEQTTVGADILAGTAYQWRVRGCIFVGGRHQVSLSNDNINSAMVDIAGCEFFLSSDYAIKTAATGGVYTHLSTDLSIYKCRFIACAKVLDNVCDSATLENCWVQQSKDTMPASTAAFRNRGVSVGDADALTRLHIKDCFLIPDVGTEGVDRVNNVRWIDNYGSFTATHSRFGGEHGGMSILWQVGAPNTAFPWISTEAIFKDCTLYAGPDARVDSGVVVINDQIPNRVVIHNCTGPVGKPLILNAVSLNIPVYMAAWEAAASRNSHHYFKIDIRDSITDIPTYAGARSFIPHDLYPYVVGGKRTVVSRAAAQSLANAFANNLISFDTTGENSLGAFDATNPTRITMPPGCTRMRITAYVQVAVDSAAKTFSAQIVSSALAALGGEIGLRGINPDSDAFSITVDVSGVAGSYWHLNVRHNAAAALNTLKCVVTATPLDLVD